MKRNFKRAFEVQEALQFLDAFQDSRMLSDSH